MKSEYLSPFLICNNFPTTPFLKYKRAGPKRKPLKTDGLVNSFSFGLLAFLGRLNAPGDHKRYFARCSEKSRKWREVFPRVRLFSA